MSVEPAPPRTEDTTPRYRALDSWDSMIALEALWEGQMAAIAAIRPALPALAAAADAAALRLADPRGRIVYSGAGTSGRLAAVDATELPPTFAWPAERTELILAGGITSLTRAVEGAEDDAAAAEAKAATLALGPADVLIGLAASGGTPFTRAALRAGRAAGALTIAIANSPGAPLFGEADHAILVETGTEAIAGSTRMKAGTAQKAVLTLLSTQIMLRLGRVHEGRMVEMRPTNAKLLARAQRMVAELAGCAPEAAAAALEAAQGEIKTAVVMLRRGLETEAARALLSRHAGILRKVLAEAPPGSL